MPPNEGSLRAKIALAATSIVLSVGLFWPTQAFAIDNVNTKKLRKAVTVAGILQHERAFQRIPGPALSKTGLYPDGSRHADLKVTGKAAKRSFKLAS
jgi:hypothetical protein